MLGISQLRHESRPQPCRGHCIDCPAVRGGILGNLIGDCVDTCQLETHTIEAREQLPSGALTPGSVVFVRRGLVIRQRTSDVDKPVAVDVVGPGGAFFVTEGDQAAYAVDRALYCTCPQEVLLGGLEGAAGLTELHQLHRQASYRLERLAEARGRQQVRSRVAVLLCAMADTLGPYGGPRTRLPSGLLQRDLAALVSTRHESVCRVMRDLAGAGIVTNGPDGIEILDRAQLATQ